MEKKTFQQRYLLQDKWWNHGKGPIFFYTGNEGPITAFWDSTGFMFDIAPEFGALIIFAEHRFYGKSLPFGNDSFTSNNVGLLSIEQALGDYAVLLTYLKKNLNATHCPVIAFGGSYGGMLSAYMRFKYPNIITGSIAASAPIFMLSNVNEMGNLFWQDVTQDFMEVDNGKCVEQIKSAFIILSAKAKSVQGLADIAKLFQLCHPIQSIRHLQGWIRNSFTYLAMLDYPYPVGFLGTSLPANPVDVACSIMASSQDVLQGLAKAAGMYYDPARKLKCFDIDSEFVECADPTGCGLGFDSMAWDYQACTEIHLPGGSNNMSDMFPVLPFNGQIRNEYCKRKWDVKPRDTWSLAQYWGTNIETASNIVFSNGVLDPWKGYGVSRSPNSKITVILIEGGAHHLDLRGSNPADPDSVIQARKVEVDNIRTWLDQYWKQHSI